MRYQCADCRFEFQLEVETSVASCSRCGGSASANPIELCDDETQSLDAQWQSVALRFPLDDATADVSRLLASREAAAHAPYRGEFSADGTPLRVGPYRLERLLGEGGFGRVYEGRHEVLGRIDAIKLPRPAAFRTTKALDEFLDEATRMGALDHPHIVPVYHAERPSGGIPYIAMKLVDGGTYRDYLADTRRTWIDQIRLLIPVAYAVHHLHTRGLIHRDLKPSNILITRQGVPYVSDLGLALHSKEQLERAPDFRCTLRYAAPEQLEGRSDHLNLSCDVYSFGAILYECLSGHAVFEGDTSQVIEQVLHRPAPPLSQGSADRPIPEVLEELILKCLSKRPDERPRSMLAVAQKLEQWLESLTGRVAAATDSGRSAPTSPSYLPTVDWQAAPDARAADRAPLPRPQSGSPVPTTATASGNANSRGVFWGIGIGATLLAVVLAWPALPRLLLAMMVGPTPQSSEVDQGPSSGRGSEPYVEPRVLTLQEPLLIDDLIPENRTIRMLTGKPLIPVRVFWPKAEAEREPRFAPNDEMLTINTRGLGGCALARTKCRDWLLDARMAHTSRTGNFGVFYGMQPATNPSGREDGAAYWQAHFISFCSDPSGLMQVRRELCFLEKEVDRYVVVGADVLGGVQAKPALQNPQRLEIKVIEGRLQLIRWNGQVIGLDDDTIERTGLYRQHGTNRPLDLPVDGWLGVANEEGATVFQRIEFQYEGISTP